MPLAPPGTRGYGDYQRTETIDSGAIFSQSTTGNNTPVSGGPLSVERYSYLGGTLSVSGGSCLVQLTWWSDLAGTQFLGRRQFMLDQGINANAQLRLVNLGPFVSIRMTQVGAGPITMIASLIATNRFHPLEFVPVSPVLVSQFGVALPANGQVPSYPGDYYAGPARLFAFAGQGYQIVPQWLDNTGSWLQEDSFVQGASSNLSANLLLPAGAWRILVINTTGVATTFNLSVAPSLTGST